MLTASTEEDKAPISGEETLLLITKDVQWSLKEITTKKVNSLTLSSMMQDCYHYCTARTRQAQSPSDDLHKGAIADCFEC